MLVNPRSGTGSPLPRLSLPPVLTCFSKSSACLVSPSAPTEFLPWSLPLVKNLPAVQETQVRSLDWEDTLEKEMATHSRILAWKISWIEKPGGLQSMGSQRVSHD